MRNATVAVRPEDVSNATAAQTATNIKTAARIALGAIAPDAVAANLATKTTADLNRNVDATVDGREEIARCVLLLRSALVRCALLSCALLRCTSHAENAIGVRHAVHIATVARTTLDAVRRDMADASCAIRTIVIRERNVSAWMDTRDTIATNLRPNSARSAIPDRRAAHIVLVVRDFIIAIQRVTAVVSSANMPTVCRSQSVYAATTTRGNGALSGLARRVIMDQLALIKTAARDTRFAVHMVMAVVS